MTIRRGQARTFNPDILGQSPADLRVFRAENWILSPMFLWVSGIPVLGPGIQDSLDQHLVLATSNRGDDSSLLIPSTEPPALSPIVAFSFRILSTITTSIDVSEGPEKTFPKLLSDYRHFWLHRSFQPMTGDCVLSVPREPHIFLFSSFPSVSRKIIPSLVSLLR
jgi:hypothetical protein